MVTVACSFRGDGLSGVTGVCVCVLSVRLFWGYMGARPYEPLKSTQEVKPPNQAVQSTGP